MKRRTNFKYTLYGIGFTLFIFLVLGWQFSPMHGTSDPAVFHLKMDQALSRLQETFLYHGHEQMKEAAVDQDIDLVEGKVRIVVVVNDLGMKSYIHEQAAVVSNQVELLDGMVETTHHHLIQALLPLDMLSVLAEYPAVKYIRLPYKPVIMETSQGVSRTGADQWQQMPVYRGGEAQVKVCILDAGFKGYKALLGNELPSSVVTRSFRADKDLAAEEVHGTACAEIVSDMAPGAELFLVNFATDVEHHNAVEWIINQGVDIISYSMGWLCAGAGDGTGPLCADVDKAAQAGIIWVSAAGNSAERHWQGKFKDLDDDKWCDFKNIGKNRDYFSFYVEKGEKYSIWLNWDDWGTWNGTDYSGAEGQDYDLYLYSSDLTELKKSTNRQTRGLYPVEGITATAKTKGWKYIRIKDNKTDRDCRLELFFTRVSNLEHLTSYGSISVPADSPNAIAVGAVDWRSDDYHSYSSLGPTSDSRVKPDICAPAGVSTVTYGENGFYGTSASTPHVAGAFALLKAKSLFDLKDIYKLIQDRILDLSPAGKDNHFGIGRLKLDK